jgi:hypothetical protein
MADSFFPLVQEKEKKPFPIEKSDGVHGKRERERTTQHENDSETSQNHTDALLLKKRTLP